jgi:hypothetical protein
MVWSVQNLQQLLAIREIQDSKSPRVAAIVGAAFVEERLELALKSRMKPDEYRLSQFFGDHGALGNFGAKVDLGYLLQMYDDTMREAMQSIARIRNFFAHSLAHTFSSQDKDFKKAMGKLVLHEGLKFYPNPLLSDDFTDDKLRAPRSGREKFVTNVRVALIYLMRAQNQGLAQGATALFFHSDTRVARDRTGRLTLREK